MLKEFFMNIFVNYYAYKRIIRHKESYLNSTGWLRSLSEKKPVNSDGEPLPWMNYSIIKLLEDRLKSDISVFEYGSGFSTLFFAKRVGSIDSIEFNADWYEQIKSSLPKNATITFVEKDIDGNYCRSIFRMGKKYDLLVIDGRDRVNCFKQGLNFLTESGVILLDDSNRDKYSECFNIAQANGFKFLSFQGLKPTSKKTFETTVFYKNNNCLNI